ncbi:hypothetical protein MBRA1_001964 [Malassezia brasiliensis]|uniref:Uncharacterized protein n=1 Tax=Malassezia brasiliensis TaxID=1821822 RepID=A0AAF0DTU0_9BASI|nr:hypothetical protein MBRA1_001964 [Malassezia brasiliensis]
MQSVDMDTLFGSNKVPEETSTKETQPVHAFTESERNGASILNALFRDAAPSEDWMKQAEASKTETMESNLPASAPTLPEPAPGQTSDETVALTKPETRSQSNKSISLDALFGSAPGTPQQSIEEGTVKTTTLPSDKLTETPEAKTAPVGQSCKEDVSLDVENGATPSKAGDESAEEKEEFIDASEPGPLEGIEAQNTADLSKSAKEAVMLKNDAQSTSAAEHKDAKDVLEASTTSVTGKGRATFLTTSQSGKSTPTTGPESQERAAQTQNLLSLLATGKAPERLAERSKHLSRMEFVQTMVTLLYMLLDTQEALA